MNIETITIQRMLFDNDNTMTMKLCDTLKSPISLVIVKSIKNDVIEYIDVYNYIIDNVNKINIFDIYTAIQDFDINFIEIIKLYLSYIKPPTDAILIKLDLARVFFMKDPSNTVFKSFNIYSIDDINNFLYNDVEKILKEFNVIVDEFINQSKITKKIFTSIIDDQHKKTLKIIKDAKSFENIQSLTLEKINVLNYSKIVKIINTKSLDLLDIFNIICLTDDVPFASFNNIYKIFRNFKPTIDYVIDLNIAIFIKIRINEKLYDVYIQVEDNKIVITFLSINGNFSKILPSFLKIFKSSVGIINDDDIITEIDGIIQVKNVLFNRYIFSDLIMNNDYFSTFISTDDLSYLATTTFKSLKIKFLYNNDIMRITKDETMLFEDCTLLHLRKIKESDLKKCIEIFGRLFTIYNNERTKISKIYSNLSDDFLCTDISMTTVLDISVHKNCLKQQTSRLKNYDEFFIKPTTYGSYINIIKNAYLKDVKRRVSKFSNKYTRQCIKIRRPVLVNDTNIIDVEKTANNSMKFPKDGDDEYICSGDTYKYIGLVADNKDNIAGPCCYTKNQDYENSLLRRYNEGKEVQKKVEKTFYTKFVKISAEGSLGILPSKITNFFKLSNTSDNFDYFCIGSNKSTNSLIECVINSMVNLDINKKYIKNKDFKIGSNVKFNYMNTGIYIDGSVFRKVNTNTWTIKISEISLLNNMTNLCIKIRTQLNNETCASFIKQENHSIDVLQIQKNIDDNDRYFDPSLYKRLLEMLYSVNITVFSNKNDGDIVKPSFKNVFYKQKTNYKKNIFILEIEDKIGYKNCELIFRVSSNNTKRSVFIDDSYVKNIDYVNSQIFKSYLPHTYDYKFDTSIFNIIGQVVDDYGKTRKFLIDYKGYNILIHTNQPIQPLFVKIIDDNIEYKIDIKVINDFKATLNVLKEDSNTIDFIIYDITCYINKQNTIQKQSILEKFNKINFNYVIIVENFFIMFKKFVQDDDIDITNSTVIDGYITKFIKNYVKIDKNFVYNDNNIDDGKLVLNDVETLKRLIFILKTNMLRYGLDLNMQNIVNSLNNMNTLKQYKHNNIFSNDTILNYIENYDYDKNTVYSKLSTFFNHAYIYSNDMISSDSLFIAMNFLSIEDASNDIVDYNTYLMSTDQSEIYKYNFIDDNNDSILIVNINDEKLYVRLKKI